MDDRDYRLAMAMILDRLPVAGIDPPPNVEADGDSVSPIPCVCGTHEDVLLWRPQASIAALTTIRCGCRSNRGRCEPDE